MARPSRPAPRHAARVLLGVAALIALLAVLVGVPVILAVAWRYLGAPIPSLQELASPDDGTLFVRVLCLVCWAGWATFTWAVLAELLAQWRGWRLPALSWQQSLAAVMLSAIAMTLSTPTIISATANPVHAAPAALHPTSQQPGAPTTAAATPAAPAGYLEHQVQPGEQMPALAERYLGDKYQWQTIAAATYGLPQPGGQQLRPGDSRIYPGWTVRIPTIALAAATTSTPRATTTAEPQAATSTIVYQARHGDWVWYIAERFLDNPLRYREIAALNPNLAAKYGGTFPDHIQADDTLRLPADARDRGPRTHAAGTTHTLAPPTDSSAGTDHAPGGNRGTIPGDTGPGDTGSSGAAPTPSGTQPATVPASPQPGASTAGPTRTPAVSPSASAAPSEPGIPEPVPSSSASTAAPVPAVAPADPGAGVELGDHGWVTADVAAAVTALAALVWIQRRRRYRPRLPGPAHRDDPDLAALPPAVAALTARHTLPAEDTMDASEPLSRDAAQVTTASLGSHADTLLRLSDVPATGAGLTGPGATSAARGLLASVLSAGGPWTPAAEATLITTTDDLERILPDHTALTADLDRLHVADTLDQALDELERQLLARARLATDTADLATAIGTDTDQMLAPTVLLTTAPTGALATRLAAVLTVGARLAVTGIVLGDWPTGKTWLVNPDGTTTIDGHDGPRLNILDTPVAREILDTLREARPASDDLPAAPPRRRPVTASPADTQSPAPASSQPSDSGTSAPAAPTGQRLRLTVLGKPAIRLTETGNDIRIRRSDGVQILVHLAVNPDGATSDQLMALLWPDIRAQFSRRRFHTTMSELRQNLADAAGEDPVARTDERYHLDPQLVAVDLWELNAAIDQAATAVDPAQHDAVLRAAITLYTGTVGEGHHWLWLAPYREATRRHLIDAYVALADAAPDARQALALIQDAIRLDPYNEDLYQQAMRLHARLGSPDGVRRTLRTLTERLAELEVRASPQTEQIATELLERLGLRERVRHAAD